VNYPTLNQSCPNPPFVQSRFTGGSGVVQAAYNASTGLVGIPNNNYYGLITEGWNSCYNGNCGLPSESVVVTACESSVTIFTVDYDAPVNRETQQVESVLGFGNGGRWGPPGWRGPGGPGW